MLNEVTIRLFGEAGHDDEGTGLDLALLALEFVCSIW